MSIATIISLAATAFETTQKEIFPEVTVGLALILMVGILSFGFAVVDMWGIPANDRDVRMV
jgi:hypothetical protein